MKQECRSVALRKFSSVHLLSRVQLFATPWSIALRASLSITKGKHLEVKLVVNMCYAVQDDRYYNNIILTRD